MGIEGLEELEDMVGTDLIQDTFLFQGLNFDETLALAGLFKKEKHKEGQVIIEEGALGQALYIIESGEVRVIKTEDGRDEEIARLTRGELFGEMSLIENELTSASVVAATDLALLVIKRRDFEALLEKDKNVALKIYKTFCLTLSDRLRRTSEELSQLKAQCAQGTKGPRPGAGTKKPPAKKSRKK
ncbi:MAG TPA: cyclic nucleotide-binding domain-containing protein [bacterium]|nr:cyclic nucleotide-binding domain-containing protein [bacterium]